LPKVAHSCDTAAPCNECCADQEAKDKLFVVLAFRYGTFSNVFPIGVFTNIDNAYEAARNHRDYRGGKYDHRIYAYVLDKFDDMPGHRSNNQPCIETKEWPYA
jgi:hypothetical protein